MFNTYENNCNENFPIYDEECPKQTDPSIQKEDDSSQRAWDSDMTAPINEQITINMKE